MTANQALTHPVVRGLSMMLVAGTRDREGYREAKTIYNRLERFHNVPASRDDVMEQQDLFLIEPDTSLSGTRLVDPRARLPVFQSIDTFIDWRLVRKSANFPWTERKSPLGSD
jgi:hypothetical protein